MGLEGVWPLHIFSFFLWQSLKQWKTNKEAKIHSRIWDCPNRKPGIFIYDENNRPPPHTHTSSSFSFSFFFLRFRRHDSTVQPHVQAQNSQRRITATLQPWSLWQTSLEGSCTLLTKETFIKKPCSRAPLTKKAKSHSPLSFKLAKSNKAPEIFGLIFSLNSCQPCTGTARASSPSLRCWQILPPTSLHFPCSGAVVKPPLPSPPHCTWGTSDSHGQAGEVSSSTGSTVKSSGYISLLL